MAYNLGWLSNGSGAPASFSDSFSSNQNPIASPWVKNSTVNQDVIVTGGVATNNTTNTNNDDAYAYVDPAYFTAPNDDYEVTVTYAAPGPDAMETEILLRLTDTSSTYSAYEVLLNGSGYEIVQINGGFGGNYVEFNGANGTPNTVGSLPVSLSTGDQIRARVTGTNPVNIQCWYSISTQSGGAWTSFINCNDSSADRKTSGQPAMGFYTSAGGGSTPGDKGWSDFSVVAV